jgi:hypothetical protein
MKASVRLSKQVCRNFLPLILAVYPQSPQLSALVLPFRLQNRQDAAAPYPFSERFLGSAYLGTA